jgi:hypothetical protein
MEVAVKHRRLPGGAARRWKCFLLLVRSSLLASRTSLLALAQDPSHKSRADRTRLGDTGLVLIGPSGVQVSEFGLNKKEGKEVRAGNARENHDVWYGKSQSPI